MIPMRSSEKTRLDDSLLAGPFQPRTSIPASAAPRTAANWPSSKLPDKLSAPEVPTQTINNSSGVSQGVDDRRLSASTRQTSITTAIPRLITPTHPAPSDQAF